MRPTDLTVGADREAAISGEVFLVRSTPMTYVEATPACARSRRSAARSRRRASATGQPRLSGRPHVPVRPGERGPALTPVAPTLAFPSPPCLAPAPSCPRSNALRVTFGRPLTFSLYILIDRPCDPGSSSAAKPPGTESHGRMDPPKKELTGQRLIFGQGSTPEAGARPEREDVRAGRRSFRLGAARSDRKFGRQRGPIEPKDDRRRHRERLRRPRITSPSATGTALA
jgi:hypothetical protein